VVVRSDHGTVGLKCAWQYEKQWFSSSPNHIPRESA